MISLKFKYETIQMKAIEQYTHVVLLFLSHLCIKDLCAGNFDCRSLRGTLTQKLFFVCLVISSGHCQESHVGFPSNPPRQLAGT